MSDAFALRENLVGDYASFVSSFVNIRDPKIREYIEGEGTIQARKGIG